MEMPRKLTVSMLRLTVIMLRDSVESVILEMELARDNCVGYNNMFNIKICFRSSVQGSEDPNPSGCFLLRQITTFIEPFPLFLELINANFLGLCAKQIEILSDIMRKFDFFR